MTGIGPGAGETQALTVTATSGNTTLIPNGNVRMEAMGLESRKPTAEESRHSEAKLAGTRGDDRGARMSDLFWTLVNTTEFSWNH